MAGNAHALVSHLTCLHPEVLQLRSRYVDVGSMFPAEYNRSLFIPEHGSWNRALQIGYRLVNVKLDENYNVTDHQVFASGWLQNQNTTRQSVWGK